MKILMVASKKALTRKWLQPDPPNQGGLARDCEGNPFNGDIDIRAPPTR